MIDQERVSRHLNDLSAKVARLERMKSLTLDELQKSADDMAIAERNLHLAVQNMLDIGAHILSGAGLNDFEQYKDIPRKLAQHGVIDRQLGERLADLAGFRNILVHAYIKVRVDIVHNKLQTCLDDFRDFATAVKPYLSGKHEEG